MGQKLGNTLAILNGLLGDYLVQTENGLAIDMGFYHAGQRLELTRAQLARSFPEASARVVVFVHGVMCTEASWAFPEGGDYGSMLQRDLRLTPFYVRYNTGQAIADSGTALAELLERLVTVYPCGLEELVLVGFSMGGLVVRSACHAAKLRAMRWLPSVQRAIYIGTPHAGAPAERVGRMVAQLLHAIPNPYTRIIAQIGDLRSAGIKDLGDADLRHEDRSGQSERVSLRSMRHPVPLLPDLAHYLIAGALWERPEIAALFGDAIVPLGSATAAQLRAEAEHVIPADHIRVLSGVSHLGLAHDPIVYAQLKRWCEVSR